jgi:hypothetical protein
MSPHATNPKPLARISHENTNSPYDQSFKSIPPRRACRKQYANTVLRGIGTRRLRKTSSQITEKSLVRAAVVEPMGNVAPTVRLLISRQ